MYTKWGSTVKVKKVLIDALIPGMKIAENVYGMDQKRLLLKKGTFLIHTVNILSNFHSRDQFINEYLFHLHSWPSFCVHYSQKV